MSDTFMGVTLIPQSTGGTIFLKFKDPRKLDAKGDPAQAMKSSKTNSRNEAIEIAKQVGVILQGGLFDCPPIGTGPAAKRVLGIKSDDEELQENVGSLDRQLSTIMGIIGLDAASKLYADGNPEKVSYLHKFGVKLQELIDRNKKLVVASESQKRTILALKAEAKELREKAASFEAQLIRHGMQYVSEYKDVLFSVAYEEYLTKSNMGHRKKISVRSVFKNFVAHAADLPLKDINDGLVLGWIKAIKPNVTRGGMEEQTKWLFSLLSKYGIPLKESREYRKKIIFDWQETPEEIYWLEEKQAKSLLKNILQQNGQYWHDAACIQYGLGFRPWELPLIQTSKAKAEKINIIPVMDNKILVRRLKTKRSAGTIEVPSWAQEAVTRRINEKNFLLFPRTEEADAKNAEWGNATEFEKKNKLWVPEAWGLRYMEVLKLAAAKVGSIDMKKFDGRTLRRTAGKEILIKNNYSVEAVAAILRDDPATVRKHYARLIPSDVSTER